MVEWAERTVALGGVAALFGYISLRAHLNTLGVSSTVPLGPERCMAELYLLMMDGLLLPAALAIFTAMAVFTVANFDLGARRLKSAARFWTRFLVWEHRWQLWLLVALAVSQALTYWLMLVSISQPPHFSVIGALVIPLHRSASHPRLTFYWLLFVCSVSFQACRSLRRASHEHALEQVPRAWFRTAVYLGSLLLFLHIPMLYGTAIHDTEYPLVRVTVEAENTCGLLVLETEHDVRVWRADNGVGRVLVYPRGDRGFSSVDQGKVLDIMGEAERAASTGRAPECAQPAK
jgi:hypothetical protein